MRAAITWGVVVGAMDGPGPIVRVHMATRVPLDLGDWLTTQAVADEWCTESYSIRPRGLHHGDPSHKG